MTWHFLVLVICRLCIICKLFLYLFLELIKLCRKMSDIAQHERSTTPETLEEGREGNNTGDKGTCAEESITTHESMISTKFLEWLECPICLETLRESPIYGCTLGHNICSTCLRNVQECPVCKTSLTTTARNIFAERILSQTLKTTPLACKFQGCKYEALVSDVITHESTCFHRLVQCPGALRSACSWSGPIYALISHIKETRCLYVLKEAEGIYSSTIGDFEENDKSALGKTTVTHWKPVLLLSDPHLRLLGHLVILREPNGNWSIYAQALAGNEYLEKFQYTLTVRAADGNHTQLSWSHKGKFLSHEIDNKRETGDYLTLGDFQVQKMCKDKTLFKYEVIITEL